MGTTVNGFPYPEGTDPVRGGDDVIKALAEAIESILMPTTWTPIVLNATYTARPGHHVPAYRVFPGGKVELRGGIDKSSNIASGNTPFTLPVEAQPAAIVAVPFGMSRGVTSNPATGRMDITAAGVASVVVIDAGASTWMSLDGVQYSKG